MRFAIEYDVEEDGRHIADVTDLPGCMAYGATRAEARRNALVVAFREMAMRLENGEELPKHLQVETSTAA